MYQEPNPLVVFLPFLIIWLLPLIIGIVVMGGQKKFSLVNNKAKIVNNGYYGYSWTYWLFGGFVPLFRGEIGTGILHIIFQFLTFGISQLIFPFLYNKQYSHRMIEKGYEVKKDNENIKIIKAKLGLIQ